MICFLMSILYYVSVVSQEMTPLKKKLDEFGTFLAKVILSSSL